MRLPFLLTLLLAVALAGCSKDEPAPPTPTPPPRPEVQFSLGNATLYGGETDAAMRLLLTFESNVDLNLSVLAAGQRLGTVTNVGAADGQAAIPLSWKEIPQKGLDLALTLRAVDALDGRRAYDGPIELRGARVVFAEPIEVLSSAGRVTGVAGSLRNDGDVPAFLTSYRVDVQDVELVLQPPRAYPVLQPGESATFRLTGGSTYPPTGPFTVNVTPRLAAGEAEVGTVQLEHSVSIVSARPVKWATAGLEQLEVVLSTSGDFPSAIRTFTWGFDGATRRSTASELRLGDPWVLEPGREHTVVLTGGASIYPNVNETEVEVEVLDAHSQHLARRSFELPPPSFDLLSPEAQFQCGTTCLLDTMTFYVQPEAGTPVYLKGWRVSVGEQRYVTEVAAEAGATTTLEKLVRLDVSRIDGLVKGQEVDVVVDALSRDGSVALTKVFRVKAEA